MGAPTFRLATLGTPRHRQRRRAIHEAAAATAERAALIHDDAAALFEGKARRKRSAGTGPPLPDNGRSPRIIGVGLLNCKIRRRRKRRAKLPVPVSGWRRALEADGRSARRRAAFERGDPHVGELLVGAAVVETACARERRRFDVRHFLEAGAAAQHRRRIEPVVLAAVDENADAEAAVHPAADLVDVWSS
jgi:hypothetical protein